MLRQLIQDLIYKVAPSVVNNAINEAARADVIARRVERLKARAKTRRQ